MPKVVHLGPANSPGGIATVIRNLVKNTPDGWDAGIISTHSPKSIFYLVASWISSRKELIRQIKKREIDIAHIHVTHSLSWWRKMSLLRICRKFEIPTVIHIHSGKFDEFCSGFPGRSVKRNLAFPNTVTVVLEKRWKEKLREWIPIDSWVVNNFSEKIANREMHRVGGQINLLLMSRDSSGKGHEFAIEILSGLQKMGVEARLKMTGLSNIGNSIGKTDGIEALGWVTEEEKRGLIEESDFLLMPSEYEGSSMTVIESIVCGLPCIVSPASKETLGIESMTLEIGNSEAWCKKIIDCKDSEVYDGLVRELKKQSKRFSVEETKRKWGSIYSSLVYSDDRN